jgi:ribulose-5-phosphate 4-epimerase/fuculose-1-phosphate aldolase
METDMATNIAASNHEMTDEEWESRQQLAACYRVFAMYGWDEAIFNHITVKVPGEDGAFLINPYGLHFSEVKASNLIKVDIDGNTLSETEFPVNKAGFVQHSLFHRHLKDAHCIIHTHTTATMAACSVEGGLRPTNFYACNFAGRLSYHDFEGVTVREEEGKRLLEDMGDNRILMLKNHGPVVIGPTLPIAFIQYWALQRACEIQLATGSMGEPIEVSDDVVAVHQRDLFMAQASDEPGKPEFDAAVRLVDRIDPSWRE